MAPFWGNWSRAKIPSDIKLPLVVITVHVNKKGLWFYWVLWGCVEIENTSFDLATFTKDFKDMYTVNINM